MTVTTPTLYDADFSLWLDQQVHLLREGQLDRLDLEHLIEEIEALGKSDKRELKHRLVVLLHHLLKWHYQPALRSGSWQSTIAEQRRRLRDLLLDSPSLKPYAETVLAAAYADARYQAALETGLALADFPEDCPYPFPALLQPEFWPER